MTTSVFRRVEMTRIFNFGRGQFSTISRTIQTPRPTASRVLRPLRQSVGDVAPKRTFETSSLRYDSRKWLEEQKFTKMIKSKERKMNVEQAREEQKYDKFRPANVVLSIVGLATGTYVGDAMERKRRLDAHDRKGHEETLTALKRGVSAASLGVAYEVYLSVATIGIHPPVVTLGSACLAYVGFGAVQKLYSMVGSGEGKAMKEVNAGDDAKAG